ncbi:MAG: carbonic anhydrase, partial [Bifidobacteriaceae bacterium]|nr:carbonic anhydrase [Bifidobacteriaceae bacterium]
MAEESTSASMTLSYLLAGNHRFTQGKAKHALQDVHTRESLVNEQHPHAAILSCADSRVPPEIIFDCGLGELFTVRNAGTIIEDDALASLEYAVEQVHVNLIIIMGHQNCSALTKAVRDAENFSLEELHQSSSIITKTLSYTLETAQEAEVDDINEIEYIHIAKT